LSRRCAGRAAKRAQAARELETGGVLPPESLIEELAAARDEFIDLRSSVLDAARTLAVTAPAQTAIDGLKALEAVVRALAEATAHESRRTTLADARRRVLAVLDRIMTINHVDDPNFAALLECQAKAREIRAAVLDPKGPTEESAAEILETTPAFSALLTLVEGREHLDDAKFAVLEDSVTRLFGRTLTVAATRGKLVAGPADLPPPSPAPVKQEVAAAAAAPEDDSAPQVVETAALDEGAQWWVSAWARWTSWKGTIDFKAGAKQELGKYAYLLSVPIQQSADY